MKEQVNVLISTYNGEKYIREQIDSILAQTWPHIQIYVRDDGSTDATLEILKQYENIGAITLFRGENIGYARSFLTLLQKAGQGGAWAFCDQDDVWEKDKILWAMQWFAQQDSTCPLLFHSAYELVSDDLSQTLGTVLPPQRPIEFHTVMTDCVYQGFSLVMNAQLRELILMCDLNRRFAHDWMACLLVQKFGVARYDERVACRHRRHDASISGLSLKNRLRWLGGVLKGNSDIKNTAKEFVRVFDNGQPDREFKMARWFTHDRYHFADAMKKFFYKKRWRSSLSSELTIRVLMLAGKI